MEDAEVASHLLYALATGAASTGASGPSDRGAEPGPNLVRRRDHLRSWVGWPSICASESDDLHGARWTTRLGSVLSGSAWDDCVEVMACSPGAAPRPSPPCPPSTHPPARRPPTAPVRESDQPSADDFHSSGLCAAPSPPPARRRPPSPAHQQRSGPARPAISVPEAAGGGRSRRRCPRRCRGGAPGRAAGDAGDAATVAEPTGDTGLVTAATGGDPGGFHRRRRASQRRTDQRRPDLATAAAAPGTGCAAADYAGGPPPNAGRRPPGRRGRPSAGCRTAGVRGPGTTSPVRVGRIRGRAPRPRRPPTGLATHHAEQVGGILQRVLLPGEPGHEAAPEAEAPGLEAPQHPDHVALSRHPVRLAVTHSSQLTMLPAHQ